MKSIKKYLPLWRFLCLLLATASIALFWQNTVLLSLLLLALACLINLKSKKSDVIYYVIVAVFGTIVESVAISTGAWVHTNQHIFNFPIWLPLYWGCGGMVIKDVYSVINQRFIRK